MMRIVLLLCLLPLTCCVSTTPPSNTAACFEFAKQKVPEMRGLYGDVATDLTIYAVRHHWSRDKAVAQGIGDEYDAVTECMARENIGQSR